MKSPVEPCCTGPEWPWSVNLLAVGVHVDAQGERHHPCCPAAIQARREAYARWQVIDQAAVEAKSLQRRRIFLREFPAVWLAIGAVAAEEK
jgi:hypothetical protein